MRARDEHARLVNIHATGYRDGRDNTRAMIASWLRGGLGLSDVAAAVERADYLAWCRGEGRRVPLLERMRRAKAKAATRAIQTAPPDGEEKP